MATLLIQFCIVVTVQLFIFLAHAWWAGKLDKVFIFLLKGCALGIPVGVCLDLVFGYYFGLWSYELGFGLPFLIFNGLLSYGLMIAKVFLLEKHSALSVLTWVCCVASLYEVTNYIFRVWNWEYLPFGAPQLGILLVLYVAFTWGIMLALRVVYRTRFHTIPF